AVAHDGQHIRAGNRMAADGADVGLDDAHRDPHAFSSSALGVHRSTSGRPHRPLLGSVPHAAFARSLAIALHPVRLTIPHAPSWNGEFFRGGFYPVAAVRKAAPAGTAFTLQRASSHLVSAGPAVVAHIVIDTPIGQEHVVGSALGRGGPLEDAAVAAVVDAVDRRLAWLLRT